MGEGLERRPPPPKKIAPGRGEQNLGGALDSVYFQYTRKYFRGNKSIEILGGDDLPPKDK